MDGLRRLAHRIRKSFRRGEAGFAIIIVLAALLMLSVLGAASLLLMVSSLKDAVNMRPEDRAFQVAESGLYVAHSKIVNNEVRELVAENGWLLGGQYSVEMQPKGGSTTEYIVTSEGSYVEGGTTYRRKIQEEVYYSGDQAFDAMRNYLFFAGQDLNLNATEALNLSIPIFINGPIRAERNMNINCRPSGSVGDGLIINGDVEGKNQVDITAAPGAGGVKVTINGNIKTGDALNAAIPGSMNFLSDGGWVFIFYIKSVINAARTANIYSTTAPSQTKGSSDDEINLGPRISQRGVENIYIPQPNLDYYKALATQQENYTDGDLSLSGNLRDVGGSSGTVYYCTGNMTLNGFAWNQPSMKGVFVCEGNFTANSTLQFGRGSRFQVIANGNATFNNDWSFGSEASSNEHFFWAGNDVNFDLGMFASQKLQVTALRDVNISSSGNLFSTSVVNYKTPDIDVSGFPIDLRITNWKELPSE